MTETQIDLTPFCDPESRYAIGKPFVRSGVLYATDGRVLICLPADGEPDSVSERRFPDMASAMNDWRDVPSDWKPWPEPLYVERLIACQTCNNTGAAHHRECSRCSGEGEIACHECDNDYDCPDCDGEGTILCGKCHACGGAKEVTGPHHIRLGEVAVSWINDQKVRTLPGLLYSILEKPTGAIVLLKFDGGRGLLMPLTLEP